MFLKQQQQQQQQNKNCFFFFIILNFFITFSKIRLINLNNCKTIWNNLNEHKNYAHYA